MRELTTVAITVAITVAMKKNKKSNSNSSNDRDGDESYSTLPEELIEAPLLQKDFIRKIEGWWEDNFKWLDLTLLITNIEISIGFELLKRFVKQRETKLLGLAIFWNPYLLEHPDIVRQIITWINVSKHTVFTGDKEYRKYLEPFAKALNPKATRTSKVQKDLAIFEKDHYSIKQYYKALRKAIYIEFEKQKKRKNRKRLFQGDRTEVLKKRFKNLSHKLDSINGKSFNQYIDALCKSSSKPSVIAWDLLHVILEKKFDVKVGIENLKKHKAH